MMILLIAVAFIFFAVALNMGKLSQVKLMATRASNMSAALMASEMASYAQYMYESVLTGEDESPGDDLTICKNSGVLAAVLSVLIIIIAMVLDILSGGATAGQLTAYAISIVLGLTGAALQAAYVEPALADMWNDQMRQLGPKDMFVERGVLTALQNAVSDQEKILDTRDFDMDGIITDEVSRFGYYVSKRLDALAESRRVNIDTIESFKAALADLLYVCQDTDGNPDFCLWDSVNSMWDPVNREIGDLPFYRNHPCNDPNQATPPECNACCLPGDPDEEDPDITKPGEPDVRPDTCTAIDIIQCPLSSDRPWVYDPFFENSGNNGDGIVSIREFVGHDDRIDDTPAGPGGFSSDGATGIFPVLWDTAVYTELNDSPRYGGTDCFWCDGRYHSQCTEDNSYLRLPFDCSADGDETDCCADTNMDDIFDLRFSARDEDHNERWYQFALSEDTCYDYDESYYRSSHWRWKPGSDEYCSEIWPYNASCPGKDCDETCADPCKDEGEMDDVCLANNSCCDEMPNCDTENFYGPTDNPIPNNATYWHDDSIDRIDSDLKEFFIWAQEIIETPNEALAANLTVWFPAALEWIEYIEDPSSRFLSYRTERARLMKLAKILAVTADDADSWRTGHDFIGDSIDTECFRDPDEGGPERVCIYSENSGICESIYHCLEGKRNTWNMAGDAIQNCYDNCGRYALECQGLYPLYIPDIIENDPCSTTEEDMVLDALHDARNKEYLYATRSQFLFSSYNTLGAMVGFLNNAADEIGEFLSSDELKDLTDEYGKLTDALAENEYFEPFAVYGWKDSEEYWHIVRVDGRLPSRCGGRCGRPKSSGGQYPEPDWPWIKQYDKNWGMRRCWTLGDSFDMSGECDEVGEYHENTRECFRGGMVKSRVIRWDQDKDPTLGLITFANNIPIWKFLRYHPDRGPAPGDLVIAMETLCDTGDGAFIINTIWGQSKPCWEAAKGLLYRGTKSETCAEYFWHDQHPRSFNVKFGRCPRMTGSAF